MASVHPIIEAQLAVEKAHLERAKLLYPSMFQKPPDEPKALGGWIREFKKARLRSAG
jgi:hypothetical protein